MAVEVYNYNYYEMIIQLHHVHYSSDLMWTNSEIHVFVQKNQQYPWLKMRDQREIENTFLQKISKKDT